MRFPRAALGMLVVLSCMASVAGQEDSGDPIQRGREMLRAATAVPYIAPDEWGGPVEPVNLRRLEDFLCRARERERRMAEAELASLDAGNFARLFEPEAMKTWSDEELEILFAAVSARGEATAAAVAEIQRVFADESRPLPVRIAAGCAGVRLGKRSAIPLLLFGARVSSEIVVTADLLSDALGEKKEEDRSLLERFRKHWCLALGRISDELVRQANNGLPRLEPGDWGAVSQWEKWWRESHDVQPVQAVLKDCYGSTIWCSRTVGEIADGEGQAESIVMDTVKEYIAANAPRSEPARLLRDALGTTYRLLRRGDEMVLFVNTGDLVKEYSCQDEMKSWRCVKSYRLLE